MVPCTSDAMIELNSEVTNIHKNAVVDFACGDCAILAKVCSLGRITASRQVDNHAERPEGGGNIGAFICSLITASKGIDLFHYCTKYSELQLVKQVYIGEVTVK